MQALEILVNSYGVATPRAARMLAEVWPRRFSSRERLLVIRPESTVRGVKLEPIKLPLSEIAAAAGARVVMINWTQRRLPKRYRRCALRAKAVLYSPELPLPPSMLYYPYL
jgi:hypothetical protein